MNPFSEHHARETKEPLRVLFKSDYIKHFSLDRNEVAERVIAALRGEKGLKTFQGLVRYIPDVPVDTHEATVRHFPVRVVKMDDLIPNQDFPLETISVRTAAVFSHEDDEVAAPTNPMPEPDGYVINIRLSRELQERLEIIASGNALQSLTEYMDDPDALHKHIDWSAQAGIDYYRDTDSLSFLVGGSQTGEALTEVPSAETARALHMKLIEALKKADMSNANDLRTIVDKLK